MTDEYLRRPTPKRRSSKASKSAWTLIVVSLAIELCAVIFGASVNTGGFSTLAIVFLPIFAGVLAGPLALIALLISAVACFGDAGNPSRVRPRRAFITSLLMVLAALFVLLTVAPMLGFF